MPDIKSSEILFIINPKSGPNKTNRILKKIRSLNTDISALVTKNLHELDEFLIENVSKYKVFIIVGGDGSVNAMLSYLNGENDKYLAVLPAGSGNGFARELGFKKKSVKSLLNDVYRGEVLDIDLLSVNSKLCINMAGTGFDSYVAHSFSKSKNRGLKNYIFYTLKSIINFTPLKASLIVDNQHISGEYQMISIANTRQFGNNALVAPMAKPNDEVFELVLVKPFPLYLYPVYVIRLFAGTLKNSKYISYFRVKNSINITSDFGLYHIDGEPEKYDKNLNIKMLETKIRIIKTSHCKF